MIWQTKPTLLALSLVLLSGCAGTLNPQQREQAPSDIAATWQHGLAQKTLAVDQQWLQTLENPYIENLVNKALNNNQALLQSAYDVQIQKQQLIISGSALWPDLDLSAQTRRSKDNRPVSYDNASSVTLELSYEVDVWGKLSDAKRQANLNYLAQQASFEQAKQQLVADVVTGWFDLVTAQQLLDLYKRREENAQQNLDIIESGYRQGINEALDVYLARNELNNERTRIANQQATLVSASRSLERLLGGYPKGDISAEVELPVFLSPINTGIPSELITRKPQLRASWYQLLVSDAGLAYAHKQRFPSLNLSASVSDSTDRVSDLFSPSSLAWSLLGSISAPIFNGGQLKANEEIARLNAQKQEQAYLDTLYDAFSDVENAITQQQSLQASYKSTLEAQENALAAEQLSFEQYQSGLVTYTTVLDAQSRSFDAQSSLIETKNQLIANRINLYVALGGDFNAPTSEPKSNNDEN
ncbi:TolC family protein [Pseudoalteromonas sp. CST5]|uniref:TolC family protein n=1 Tax=unclassified Pseudoalteromonas TaxID=194690 RepID=UPI0023589808|nr:MULTISPECIES: TolC family protein [unclassified Pseudoalteromonas]MDC9514937.1 TolC family protein [Pseudoalteromonas sp. CST1]MDC9539276.1 TolC family protein [Pseudoalteromonas sp. CST3]MDC9543322.1 TolC family protein [Pseudoalteromonas sp. CST2]MDC9546239.1 TolC family protein [Pseudoalteromonas sp. CST4]MDC9551026.1 TolC family protein [Pseudoalteromonas sp. CST5]